ncbi:hypothetical protein SmB9_06620 [Sphingosinicella microcystinivorans]|uniref:OmpA family protein n=1 Tax=Sphingosinicella microcystinivorans TaxID=335406 RepID=A0AAD1D435_SPHMI|nr:hypothetical protein SmB9_06620 [Sphingosinicella microcystinivorans]
MPPCAAAASAYSASCRSLWPTGPLIQKLHAWVVKGQSQRQEVSYKEILGPLRAASNDSAEGKAQNRRVTVNILVSKGLDGI